MKAVIGDGCQLNEGVIVKPQVKIWPDKIIEGSIIQSNIIWEFCRQISGKDGISGSGSVCLAPDHIAYWGIYWCIFGPGTKTAVSYDSHPGNAMLKHGLIWAYCLLGWKYLFRPVDYACSALFG